MKLCFSATSPYVRKVMVVAHEIGLTHKIELIPTNAWADDSPIVQFNPLRKVPALQIDGGECLYDSPVICEYLDSLHDGQPLFPAKGGERWAALRLQAIGDGIMDAGVLRMKESMRPDGEKSQAFIGRQADTIGHAIDALEDLYADEADAQGSNAGAPVTIGTIAVGAALGYLDFRFESDAWRSRAPTVADWYEEFMTRPSMAATVPQDPK